MLCWIGNALLDLLRRPLRGNVAKVSSQIQGKGEHRYSEDLSVVAIEGLKIDDVDLLSSMPPRGARWSSREPVLSEQRPESLGYRFAIHAV